MLPAASLIGAEDDGWRVATGLLFHERNMVGGNSLNDHVSAAARGDGEADSGSEIIALARAAGRASDPLTRQLVGEALVLQALEDPTISRINALLAAGRMPAPGGGHRQAAELAVAVPDQGDRAGDRRHRRPS